MENLFWTNTALRLLCGKTTDSGAMNWQDIAAMQNGTGGMGESGGIGANGGCG